MLYAYARKEAGEPGDGLDSSTRKDGAEPDHSAPQSDLVHPSQ